MVIGLLPDLQDLHGIAAPRSSSRGCYDGWGHEVLATPVTLLAVVCYGYCGPAARPSLCLGGSCPNCCWVRVATASGTRTPAKYSRVNFFPATRVLSLIDGFESLRSNLGQFWTRVRELFIPVSLLRDIPVSLLRGSVIRTSVWSVRRCRFVCSRVRIFWIFC